MQSSAARKSLKPMRKKPSNLVEKPVFRVTQLAKFALLIAFLLPKNFASQTFASDTYSAVLSAAESGDVVAQTRLGHMLYAGQGIPQNHKKAVQWYRMAAEQGFAAAEYELGLMLVDSKALETNYVEAAKWLSRSASRSYSPALYVLGLLYSSGKGVRRDIDQAIKLWRDSALLGHAEAQYKLGSIYYQGLVVSKNDGEALKWFGKAAAQGFALAQYQLAYMYQHGIGTQLNFPLAMKWYGLAADNGISDASQALEKMARNGEPLESNHQNRDAAILARRREVPFEPDCLAMGFKPASDALADCSLRLSIHEKYLLKYQVLEEEAAEERERQREAEQLHLLGNFLQTISGQAADYRRSPIYAQRVVPAPPPPLKIATPDGQNFICRWVGATVNCR